jgi:6-phosphogluconolactonase (cycloisomerase 2 family)
MKKSLEKARIGVIAILGLAALAIVGFRSALYSATPIPATAGPTLYVTDDDSDAVTAYAAASNGDVAPLTPAPTGLSEPQFVAVDANGNIYATNPFTASVTIYAKGSKGDVAPIATIGGSNTGLNSPEGIALDSSGKIYVTNCPACSSNSGSPSVTVYPALGSSAGPLNEAPTATIGGGSTGLNSPEGIALDSSSGAIFVADSGAASVFVYPAGSSGNVAPSATISGATTGLVSPVGVAEKAGGDIYVADDGNSKDSIAASVFVFSSGSNGDVAPIATISGSKTGLNSPSDVALDTKSNIYVTNDTPSVTVYSASSSGNVAPTATISGGKTDLEDPIGVTLDSTNNIYVADDSSSSVTVFSALGSSTGTLNEAPTADISTTATTGLTRPQELALDSKGKIYVADDLAAEVFVYPAGSNGNDAAVATISGGNTGLNSPFGLTLDSSNNIYVADYGSELHGGNVPASVFVFASGSNGNVAPTTTISGSETGLINPFGIALDSSRNIYVADDGNSAASIAPSVIVFSAASHGDAAPLHVIAGTATGLNLPCGVALDSNDNIYVADFSAASVTVYAAGSDGDAAPLATISGGNTGLQGPCGIALDSSNNIYVSDEDAASLFVYPALGSSTGTLNESPNASISGAFTELGEPQFVAIQPAAGATPTPTATATAPGATPTATATGATPTATPTPVSGKLSISPGSLGFGNKVTVGTTSKAKTVTIKNDGKKKTGVAVSIEGESTAPPFTVKSECDKTLEPGKSCKVSVTFTPPDTTAQSGTLTINDDVTGSPQSVGLSGTGKAPKQKK